MWNFVQAAGIDARFDDAEPIAKFRNPQQHLRHLGVGALSGRASGRSGCRVLMILGHALALFAMTESRADRRRLAWERRSTQAVPTGRSRRCLTNDDFDLLKKSFRRGKPQGSPAESA